MRRSAKIGLIGVAAGLFAVGTSSPAFAHYTERTQGNDWAYVNSGHRSGGVDDRECDGNDTYQKVYTHALNTFTYWTSGCNAPTREWGGLGSDIDTWWLCEDSAGPWHSIGGDDKCTSAVNGA